MTGDVSLPEDDLFEEDIFFGGRRQATPQRVAPCEPEAEEEPEAAGSFDNELRDELKAKDAEIEALQQKLRAVEFILGQRDTYIDNLRSEKNAQAEKIEDLRSEIKDLKAETSQAHYLQQRLLAGKDEKLRAAEAKAKEQAEEIEDLKAREAPLQRQLEFAREELEAMRGTPATEEWITRRLARTDAYFKGEMAELKEEHAELDRRISKLRTSSSPSSDTRALMDRLVVKLTTRGNEPMTFDEIKSPEKPDGSGGLGISERTMMTLSAHLKEDGLFQLSREKRDEGRGRGRGKGGRSIVRLRQ